MCWYDRHLFWLSQSKLVQRLSKSRIRLLWALLFHSLYSRIFLYTNALNTSKSSIRFSFNTWMYSTHDEFNTYKFNTAYLLSWEHSVNTADCIQCIQYMHATITTIHSIHYYYLGMVNFFAPKTSSFFLDQFFPKTYSRSFFVLNGFFSFLAFVGINLRQFSVR